MKKTLKIAHLYPKRMNIYGDRGNIMAMARRAEWRGIKVEVAELEVGEKLVLGKFNLFFFGGGQDQEQHRVAADLAKRGNELKGALDSGAALLAVCGGYQLLGHYYQPVDAERLEGVGVFDAHTEAGPKRLIGNVVADSELANQPLVGFENHSGLTWLGTSAQPLATVTSGFGNNGQDQTEGCVAGNAIGTYLHGSLLPKNPQLADWLIGKALDIPLKSLPDHFEQDANQAVVSRFG